MGSLGRNEKGHSFHIWSPRPGQDRDFLKVKELVSGIAGGEQALLLVSQS